MVSLIKRFGLIAVEALVVRNLVKNPHLAKSIADAAWSSFFAQLLDKAEEAGRAVVRVDPAYTSSVPTGVVNTSQGARNLQFALKYNF